MAETEVLALELHACNLCALSCQWPALELMSLIILVCLLYSSTRAFGDFSVYNAKHSKSNGNGKRDQLQASVQPTDENKLDL